MASKRALIVWGDWEGHTPKQCAEVFAPYLQAQGFEVDLSNTLDSYRDTARLAGVSLIVPIWTMGELTPEQSAGLLGAVRAGAGLAGFHGGIIDSFRTNTDYQWMTGDQWVAHPGNGIPTHHVKIVDRDHPITCGISDFDIPNSEQYYMHVDPGNQVLCTSEFTGAHGDPDLYRAGTVMPYAWTKTWGKGRVFVAAWGHSFKDFDVPEAKEIVARGMIWAAK